MSAEGQQPQGTNSPTPGSAGKKVTVNPTPFLSPGSPASMQAPSRINSSGGQSFGSSGVDELSDGESLAEAPPKESVLEWFWRCTKLLIIIVLPVAFSASLANLNLVYTFYVASHTLSNVDFAGFAMGLTFMNMTANGIGVGMTFALDTLVSQEVGRDPKSKRVGLYLQRSFICTVFVFILLHCMYMFSEPVVSRLITHEVAIPAAYFLRFASLICVPTIGTGAIQKVVQCLGLSNVGLYGSIVGTIAIPFLLAHFAKYGLGGIAIAIAIHRTIIFVSMMLLVWWRPRFQHCWPGWSKRALGLKGIKRFISVGIPCVWSYCADLWGFEAMAVIAGRLGALDVAGWVLSMNLCTIMWGLSTGICAAGSVRVGQALGAGDARDAKLMMRTSVILSGSIGLVAALVVKLQGPQIMHQLQSDARVVALAETIINWTCAGLFFNVQFYVLQGLFRGCGQQKMCVRFVIIAYWVIGVPMALYLVFIRGFGIDGIMYGFVSGMSVVCPVLFYLLFWNLDMDSLAVDVAMRREQSTIEMDLAEQGEESELLGAQGPQGSVSSVLSWAGSASAASAGTMSTADSYGTFAHTATGDSTDGPEPPSNFPSPTTQQPSSN